MKKLILIAAIACAATPAAADKRCGFYATGAHQAAIVEASGRETLLDNLDAFIATPPRGTCVCAYGKVRGETFATLRKMMPTPCSDQRTPVPAAPQ